MGAYKHNVVAVIKMGAYIHGVLIFCVGAYYPDFTVSETNKISTYTIIIFDVDISSIVSKV